MDEKLALVHTALNDARYALSQTNTNDRPLHDTLSELLRAVVWLTDAVEQLNDIREGR